MKSQLAWKAAALGSLAGLILVLPMAEPVAAKDVIRLSTYVNEVDIRYKGFEHFAELVAEKTGGEVEVQIFGSATMHGWSEGMDAALGGVVDMTWISYDSRLPCYRAGGFYPTRVDLSRQIEMDAEFSSLIEAELADNGLVNIFNSNYSYDQEWWFEEPIADIGKLDGKQVRSIGPLVSMMIEAWGGSPVFVAPKEVFQSAERGVVDGINMGVATYSSWKLWTVMPYMVNANLFYGNIMYMMNKDKFDSFDEETQQAILDAGRETEEWLKPQYEAWVNERVGDAVMKGGGAAVAIPADESDALIATVQDKWNEEMDSTCGGETGGKLRALFEKYEP